MKLRYTMYYTIMAFIAGIVAGVEFSAMVFSLTDGDAWWWVYLIIGLIWVGLGLFYVAMGRTWQYLNAMEVATKFQFPYPHEDTDKMYTYLYNHAAIIVRKDKDTDDND